MFLCLLLLLFVLLFVCLLVSVSARDASALARFLVKCFSTRPGKPGAFGTVCSKLCWSFSASKAKGIPEYSPALHLKSMLNPMSYALRSTPLPDLHPEVFRPCATGSWLRESCMTIFTATRLLP